MSVLRTNGPLVQTMHHFLFPNFHIRKSVQAGLWGIISDLHAYKEQISQVSSRTIGPPVFLARLYESTGRAIAVMSALASALLKMLKFLV